MDSNICTATDPQVMKMDVLDEYVELMQAPASVAEPGQLPVVYSPRYNITFFGLEKLHPFDSGKFHKISVALSTAGLISQVRSF